MSCSPPWCPSDLYVTRSDTEDVSVTKTSTRCPCLSCRASPVQKESRKVTSMFLFSLSLLVCLSSLPFLLLAFWT